MVDRLVRVLAVVYSRLPVKPFRGVLKRLSQYYYRKTSRDRNVIATIDGITYELDLNELIDSSIYYEGCFEPLTTAVINKYVKAGMAVFDIGANIGCHTLRCAKLVGGGGKVIAFEPMAWAFSKLKRNVELNGCDNITLEKLALSHTISRGLTYFRSSWTLGGRSVPDSESSEEVDFITLDEYVARNNISKIDFIKLDVDGYEYKIIQGGIGSIRKFQPVMIIEFGKCMLKNHGDSVGGLIDLLTLLGYSFYPEKDVTQCISKEALLDAVPKDATINVVCRV